MYEQEKKNNRIKINDYKLSSDNGRVSFYPAYIQLEQTNRCNAECIMCNHFFLGNKGAQDIEPLVIEKMKDIFPYCETLMLNGDGEPFFSSHISEQISLYKSFGMRIGTNTNLCYIPDDCWELFSEGFDFLNVSCDGASAEVFETVRRRLSYSTFVANVNRLNEVAPNLGKNLDCVIMRENINEIVQIVEFAYNNRFKSVRFHRMGINPCIGNFADADEEFERFAAYKVLEAENRAKELGIQIQIPSYPDNIQRINQLDIDLAAYEAIIDERQRAAKEKFGSLRLDTDYYSSKVSRDDFEQKLWDCDKHCQWAVERCYIDLKGNVTTCCFNMKKNMGNLLEKSFDEIWNGEEYQQLRKIMAERKLPDFCRNCNWIKEGRF